MTPEATVLILTPVKDATGGIRNLSRPPRA
jgi:hypothetical protein